jgi:D-alanyl-D-alanine carboxypeptidase
MNQIDRILTAEVDNHATPSVQYMFFNSDRIIHKFSYGDADVINHIPVNEATTYNYYSITKTFTALAILQLASLKLINIDEPVIKFLPEFRYSPEITVKQLLTHTAGIPNPIPLKWIHPADEHKNFDGKKFFDQIFLKNIKTKFSPGERFSYSNLGYVVLGMLIEKVSGMTYEKYITDNILRKLYLLSDIGFTVADPARHAKGYHKRMSFSYFVLGFLIDKEKSFDGTEGKWKSFLPAYVNGAAYGGITGSPESLIKYVREYLKPDSGLIPDGFKKVLFMENHTRDNKATGMCLSWFTGKLNGKQYFTHAGGGGGYYCEIRVYPEEKSGSVILFNRTGMSDERFLDKTDRYYIE